MPLGFLLELVPEVPSVVVVVGALVVVVQLLGFAMPDGVVPEDVILVWVC